jgi:hypothetical protein
VPLFQAVHDGSQVDGNHTLQVLMVEKDVKNDKVLIFSQRASLEHLWKVPHYSAASSLIVRK